MYEQYFGFNRTPFRLESEPDMFFFGESQKNVLTCIKSSLKARKGIITLSGLPGSGKTTVMRRAIEESIVPDTIICRINRSRCHQFLPTLKREIFIRQKTFQEDDYESIDLHELVKNAVEEKKHYLIVVDESQQLANEEVDELFSLASIDKNSEKHFKFLLVSHEPFNEYFDIEQYANSSELVSTHCFLMPLMDNEILPYVKHRLDNAGWKNCPSFDENIQGIVFIVTKGIPRRINSFFDRLMLFSYFEGNKNIDVSFVRYFCRDLLAELNTQTHPDLDSFDLRQALRKEKSVFSLHGPELPIQEDDEDIEHVLIETPQDVRNAVRQESSLKAKLPIEEPLSSEDPEELILFVSHFINNPERYKNYTDRYYKIPKNLTLLLCLATETDKYIDEITPYDLANYSAVEIKEMIVVFIEKMLITSRFDPSRVLGLDESATEEEINRHFSYMMRICRSQYLKTDKDILGKKIKDAYIRLLSKNGSLEGEIPVVVSDVVSIESKRKDKEKDRVKDKEKAPSGNDDESKNAQPEIEQEYNIHDPDDDFFYEDIDEAWAKKIQEIDKAKEMLNDVSSLGHEQANENSDQTIRPKNSDTSNKRSSNEKSKLVPRVAIGLATAAGIGYLILNGGMLDFYDPNVDIAADIQPSLAETESLIAQARIPGSETNANAITNASSELGKKTVLANEPEAKLAKPKQLQMLSQNDFSPSTNNNESLTVSSNSTSAIDNGVTAESTAEIERTVANQNQTAVSMNVLNKSSFPVLRPVESTEAGDDTFVSEDPRDVLANFQREESRRDAMPNSTANIAVATIPNVGNDDGLPPSLADVVSEELIAELSEENDVNEGVIALADFTSPNMQDTNSDLAFNTEFDDEVVNPIQASQVSSVLIKTATSDPENDFNKNSNISLSSANIALLGSQVDLPSVNEELVSNQNIGNNDDVFLEKLELDRVITNLIYTYENADIEELETMFTENAVTNDGFNREQILEDYELIFDETESRSIKISNVTWKVDDTLAVGTGRFRTSAVGIDDEVTVQKEGQISIKVINSEETKKITELFFLYQFAEAE